MKCINCLTEMKNKSYDYYGFGDWDMDYPASHHEEYRCPNCKCKYIREDYGEGKWEIPKKVEKPTEKQVNTILFINNKLQMDLKPITKQQCIRDIEHTMCKRYLHFHIHHIPTAYKARCHFQHEWENSKDKQW